MLARIETAVKSEVEGMHFDRKNVKASIMAIANPKKAEAKIKAQKAEEDARQKEEQEKADAERVQREKEETARANIWNFLNQFVDDN